MGGRPADVGWGVCLCCCVCRGVQELRKRLAGLVLYLRCGIDFQPKALARVLTLLPTFPCLRVLGGWPALQRVPPCHQLSP